MLKRNNNWSSCSLPLGTALAPNGLAVNERQFSCLFLPPHGMWDLGSPTNNGTWALCIGETRFNHWTARKSNDKQYFRPDFQYHKHFQAQTLNYLMSSCISQGYLGLVELQAQKGFVCICYIYSLCMLSHKVPSQIMVWMKEGWPISEQGKRQHIP